MQEFTQKEFSHGSVLMLEVPESTGCLVVCSGLGSAVSTSNMARKIVEISNGRVNLILLELPYHGINAHTPNRERFTFQMCREHVQEVVRSLPESHPNISKIIGITNSLGLWSLYQALQNIDDTRFKFIIAKSGIVSYKKILKQLGGIDGAKKALQMNGDNWGSLPVNTGDTPVKIHLNALNGITSMKESCASRYPIHAFHGTQDQWTSHEDMRIFVQDSCPTGSTFSSYETDHGFHGVPEIDTTIAKLALEKLGIPSDKIDFSAIHSPK